LYLAVIHGEHLDLSVQAYIASFLEQNFIYHTYLGRIASRLGKRLPDPWGILCALFNQWSQGKKSLLLHLTKPEGIAIR
jgi:hypothetical protein